MLIAVGSVKGSPGVTSLALGLAVLWPQPGAVLIEADPAGGDLWARWGHHPDPGLTHFAAAARRDFDAPIISVFRQRLRIGADVVLAPPADAATAPVALLAARGLPALRQAADNAVVVMDVGRLDPASPALGLAAAADHVLLLVSTRLDAYAHVAARLPALAARLPGRLWLVRTAAESTRASGLGGLDHPVIGTLPRSRWGAGVLSGQLSVANWRRLRLGRAIARIAARLAAQPSAARQATSPAQQPDRPR
ncbi:hypothetical protein [Phytohabitans kaempferiae]|uniref:Uncharacterized protein n=1 Tax=Phytohabitans kaempferiae TaxID=1620943 RepID=A0ABV6M9I2_9ACTN